MHKFTFIISIFLLNWVCTLTVHAGDIDSESLVNTTTSWNGAELPAYPPGKPEISVVRITISPGTRIPWHQHPIISAGVLLRGTLTVRTKDNKTLVLKAGEAAVETVHTWHYGINDGTEPAELIVFYAGVHGTPVTMIQTSP